MQRTSPSAVDEVRAALGAAAFAASVEVGAELSDAGLVAFVQQRIVALGA